MTQPEASDSWLTPYVERMREIGRRADVAANQVELMNIELAKKGASFTLHYDQAKTMLTEASKLRDELGDDKSAALQLLSTAPAAEDTASKSYTKKLTRGAGTGRAEYLAAAAFDSGATQVQAQIDFLDTLISRLHKALGMQINTEHHNEAAVKKVEKGIVG